MMRIVDALMSVPVLFLFMLIATMIPPTVPVLIIIMSALSWLGTSRLIRGEALSLRTREYASRCAAWAVDARAIRTHIVRNTIGTVIVKRDLPGRRTQSSTSPTCRSLAWARSLPPPTGEPCSPTASRTSTRATGGCSTRRASSLFCWFCRSTSLATACVTPSKFDCARGEKNYG